MTHRPVGCLVNLKRHFGNLRELLVVVRDELSSFRGKLIESLHLGGTQGGLYVAYAIVVPQFQLLIVPAARIGLFHQRNVPCDTVFHYTCGIRARNERINLFAKRAEAAELQIKKLSDEILELSRKNQKLSDRVQQLADKSKRLASEKLERNARIAKLKGKLKKEQEAQKRLKNSISWKVGRAITAIPRRVKRLFSK